MNLFATILHGLRPILLTIGVTTAVASIAANKPVTLVDARNASTATASVTPPTFYFANGQGVMPPGVLHWKSADAFAKVLLWERKVYAIRRLKPGTPETHGLEADIMFVVDGSATFVTGGSITDPRQDGDETVGTAIQDGEARQIEKGDVVIVPKGTPHWFQSVNGSISYFAVKLR